METVKWDLFTHLRSLSKATRRVLNRMLRQRELLPTCKVLEVSKPFVRETIHYPSHSTTGFAVCAKKLDNVYTGDNIVGIGTMHKSNAVPIFNDNQAKDLATMRRG